MDPAVRKPRLTAAAGLGAVLLLWVSATHATDGHSSQQRARQTQVIDLIDSGRFSDAEALLATAGDTTEGTFQRERMRRIRLDFSLDEAAAKAAVRRWIPDLTDEEFARWDQLGLIEHLDTDGERWYFKRAPSNLFLLSDEARARRRTDAPMPPPGPN
ncbi:MAG: transglutaminase domain-containing protein, partial [Pseudomonadota bacterium]